jgi:LacI family transcriptional regulator
LTLTRPVGVFAVDDAWGFQLAAVCSQAGLHVPEEVAIVGVDNDDLLCELARPSLSSIPLSAHKVGLEAAALLNQMLQGAPAPEESLLIPPADVVCRRSSDILAIADEDVSQAVRFIRDHGHEPLRVEHVLAAVPVARRSLERRFRAVLGHGILVEIRHAHVQRACRLLTETDFSIATIAESAGFSGPKQFWLAFQQFLGQTPKEFRLARRHRKHA